MKVHEHPEHLCSFFFGLVLNGFVMFSCFAECIFIVSLC